MKTVNNEMQGTIKGEHKDHLPIPDVQKVPYRFANNLNLKL